MLVPFLVFAIGMSHGAQKMNGIMQDIGRGTHRVVAARFTFRRLFLAGLTALLADAVGFAVLMMIKIPVIQDLAVDRQPWRAGVDFHQPDSVADPALVHRCQQAAALRERAKRKPSNANMRGMRSGVFSIVSPALGQPVHRHQP